MCDKLLMEQKFHHKDGKFYCADDYVLKFCHTCRQCKEKILQGSVIQAFGGYYHPEHFVCATCLQPFKNGKYYENNGSAYCEEHYFSLTAEKCDQCKKPVDEAAGVGVRVQGKLYHTACLSCHHCGVSLANRTTIFQKDSNVYCQEDFQNFFCKRCTTCGQHLLQNCITVNDEFYHPECLACSVCKKLLTKYICVEGHLRCEQHTEFSTDKFTCSVCSKTIDKDIIRSVGKKVHEACFNCSVCGTPLAKATATLRGDRLSCQKCVSVKEAPDRPKVLKESATGQALAASSSSSRKTGGGRSRDRRDSKQEDINASPRNRGTSLDAKVNGSKIEWKKGELIGKGSFGKVFMGMNAQTGELIAVKQVVIKTTEDQDQAKEIENEITLMQNLRHRNIVTLLGTQRQGNKLNILMEYVPGKSLDSLLEKFGAFSEKVIKSYTYQLLEALAYCHAAHVVHRDIKGKNILIDTKGNLKLADFGSAKRVQNIMSKDAPSVSYNYTPLWTAPEVLVGDYNSKVDVWSLGCVIIEMASGKPPWAEQNFENPFRALYHIGNSNAIPKIPDTLSDVGKEFVVACLSRDPDKRPSAAELLRHPWLQDLGDNDDESDRSDSEDDLPPRDEGKTTAKSNGSS